jgi:preprotein translocase subunit SecY
VKFIETIKNIYKIEDLRNKIFYTLLLVLVYRIGSFIILPGVDPNSVNELASSASAGILGLINVFAGGAFSRASVMALGIMPYISASIAVQLLSIAVPYFQKLQKEGESGRRQINQITRYLTVAVTMVQGFAYLAFIQQNNIGIVFDSIVLFRISSMIVLTSGTLFAMWLGEKITDNGIGNGISLLIMIGIIANLPGALWAELVARANGAGLMIFVLEIAILFVIVMATIALVQATRKVPVQYAKRNVVKDGKVSQAGGVRQYLPLKVNASGVMPIIFAQALMFLPATLASFSGSSAIQNSTFLISITDPRGFLYNLFSFLLVVVFTYFYTALIINPTQIADQLKKDGGFIPGVKPGLNTAEYIDSVVSRITLPGSLFLGFIAILPAFALIGGVNMGFSYFFGGTSLLIMVAVVLDTLQQVESHLLMRHYDGLTKSGRIKGRQSVGAAI